MRAAGPFTGEPGYELLYWLPYLRSLNGAAYDCAITRGGAGLWYEGRTIDAYDEIGFESYRDLLEQRYRIARVEKSFGPSDILDREILRAVECESVVHPAQMYQRLWDAANWPFARLKKPAPLPGLAPGYIAARFYTSFQLPANAPVLRVIAAARKNARVVALVPERALDNHGEHRLPNGIKTVTYGPETSLETISRVVAHAEAFLSTYGGLSYLGPHYGVPTRAFHRMTPNEAHRAQERRMAEDLNADYELVRV